MRKKSTLLVIILFFSIIVGFTVIEQQDTSDIATVGQAAPDIELFNSNRDKTTLSSLKGSVVFINFWATWCESCVEELPSINRLFSYFDDNTDLKIVTILYKDDIHNALEYMSRNRYSFPVFFTMDSSAAKKYGITGIPESFIIDKKGIVRDKIIGPADWDTRRALEIFQMLMNEPA